MCLRAVETQVLIFPAVRARTVHNTGVLFGHDFEMTHNKSGFSYSLLSDMISKHRQELTADDDKHIADDEKHPHFRCAWFSSTNNKNYFSQT